jgi:hypothetical protein
MRRFNVNEELESAIDHSSVRVILEIIAGICYEKAAHIEENWQDKNTARVWDRAGKRVEATAAKVNV